MWLWENSESFDRRLQELQDNEIKIPMTWVDCYGNTVKVGGEIAASDHDRLQKIQKGELIGDISELLFRDPNHFRAGELHNHFEYWQYITRESPSPQQAQILEWIRDRVSIQPFFRHFKGSFRGESYDSDKPPMKAFKNNVSCRSFVTFVEDTLIARLKSGAISLLGKVGVVDPPFIVLPLMVEPTKPRLCHDARYLNLWMCDMPFSLDRLIDLPRYVNKDTYQTVLDDKSGYDHILLSEDSRTYFGIQWGGWYFTYNTLPFGWKISPFVYHTTGLLASNFFRASGIPCLLYIDDRHNGELQVALDKGEYATLNTVDDRHLAAARSAIFLVAYHLVRLGYFLGLQKSILFPSKVVPYLGFLADSSREVFCLKPEKKEKFLYLVREILENSKVTVKTLQRLVGKCVSFGLAVPAAQLFTRQMNVAIASGQRTPHRLIAVKGELREEISHWLFLQDWDDPVTWRDERHVRVSIATDASASGWGAILLAPHREEISDYWTNGQFPLGIAAKEASAVDRALVAFRDKLFNAHVDAFVDNKAVVDAWNNQGGRSIELNTALKQLFFTTSKLNVSLHMSYIPTGQNPADAPSRRLSHLDSKLSDGLWEVVQREFGGKEGHSCDLMALDSNAMRDVHGNPLPHFTPIPSPGSSGVNLFTQDLVSHGVLMTRPYVFPPMALTGPVLKFLQSYKQSCTVVVLDMFPKKYWWPILVSKALKSKCLAVRGDSNALFVPSRKGWVPHKGIPGDLWVFAVCF